MNLLVGIFVGGRSSRMGRAKGVLPAPGKGGLNLVERLVREVKLACPGAPIVLVGQRPEYAAMPFPTLADAAVEKGPLGGLVSLLAHAQKLGSEAALALACDLPYLESTLIRRVAEADPEHQLVAPRQDGRFQPLTARYSPELLASFRTALEAEQLALQPLIRGAAHLALELSADEEAQLRDWDTPEDVARG